MVLSTGLLAVPERGRSSKLNSASNLLSRKSYSSPDYLIHAPPSAFDHDPTTMHCESFISNKFESHEVHRADLKMDMTQGGLQVTVSVALESNCGELGRRPCCETTNPLAKWA